MDPAPRGRCWPRSTPSIPRWSCVEGPPEAEPLLDLAADPAMVPPVPSWPTTRSGRPAASFWPLAAFSPGSGRRSAGRRTRSTRAVHRPPAAHSLAADEDEGRRGSGRAATRWPRWRPPRVRGRRALVGRPGRARRGRRLRARRRRDGRGPGDRPPASSAGSAREAAMRPSADRRVAEGFGPHAVVCGAWHVPALRSPPTRPTHAAALRGRPRPRWR
jgi:hypothetical protein